MTRKTVFCVLSLALLLSGCANKPAYRESRVLMGTFVEVISSDPRAGEIAFGEIKRIEGLLSKYIPESEISKLNRSGKATLSAETYFVISRARDFWKASEGAFDITVGPLLDTWGFTDKKYRVPDETEIKKALDRIGFDKVMMNDSERSVEFSVPGMEIDLGAIGKGFAEDCAARKLKESGIKDCLINAGGQIYCLGTDRGKPWNIAVRKPFSAGEFRSFKLTDQSASTSGGYEQYFIYKGKHYAHIFNPKTGYPVEPDMASVTVIAPDGLTADALSTSIFALGKLKGRDLADEFPGVQTIIIDK